MFIAYSMTQMKTFLLRLNCEVQLKYGLSKETMQTDKYGQLFFTQNQFFSGRMICNHGNPYSLD